ncbi:MAG: hypothetical protein ACOC8I_03335, partial [Desulfosalsimonas sp.]
MNLAEETIEGFNIHTSAKPLCQVCFDNPVIILICYAALIWTDSEQIPIDNFLSEKKVYHCT